MSAALLMVDLQNDFLHRQRLATPLPLFVERCGLLLEGCRHRGVPVYHIHTLVRADGSDRMPHWKRDAYWACVENTSGSEAPPLLKPLANERVFGKTFYSGFQNPELEPALAAHRPAPLIVAGLYLHACVCATVLDAYQRGHEVWIAAQAVTSTERAYYDSAHDFLTGRAAAFMDTADIFARLDKPDAA